MPDSDLYWQTITCRVSHGQLAIIGKQPPRQTSVVQPMPWHYAPRAIAQLSSSLVLVAVNHQLKYWCLPVIGSADLGLSAALVQTSGCRSRDSACVLNITQKECLKHRLSQTAVSLITCIMSVFNLAELLPTLHNESYIYFAKLGSYVYPDSV